MRITVAAALAATLAAALAATLAAVTVGCSSSTARPPTPDPAAASAAAQQLLVAWQRNLTTSWAVTATVDRTTSAGRHVAFPQRQAQRPPDHVNTGLGTVDARLGDRRIGCSVGSTGTLTCGQQGGAPPYAEVIAGQLATLRTYVVGPTALYLVAQLAGCFELRLRLDRYPSPPYGKVAVFCFDPATGAPAGSVIARGEGTDRTTVTDSHSPATDTDLLLPTGQEMAAITKLVGKAFGP